MGFLYDNLLIWSNVAYLLPMQAAFGYCDGWWRTMALWLLTMTMLVSFVFHSFEVLSHNYPENEKLAKLSYFMNQVDDFTSKFIAIFAFTLVLQARGNLLNYVLAVVALSLLIISANQTDWNTYVWEHSLWHVSGALVIWWSFYGYCNPELINGMH